MACFESGHASLRPGAFPAGAGRSSVRPGPWFRGCLRPAPCSRRQFLRTAVHSLERAGPPPAEAGPSSKPDLGDLHGHDWQELLDNPDSEMFGTRARSASDAAVLRRKGHLKEQDKFINFLQDMHRTHTCLEVMQKVERWAVDHHRSPKTSRLRRMVPSLGSFFTPLK